MLSPFASPLRHRYPRQLKAHVFRYLALFVFLVLSIGVIFGYINSAQSMSKTYQAGPQRYNMENGHFDVTAPLSDQQIQDIERTGVTLTAQPHQELKLDDTLFRIFPNRERVNKSNVWDGQLPAEGSKEIAIERLAADNHHWKIGDVLHLGGQDLTISGIISLPDYSVLFRKNGDFTFDVQTFALGTVDKQVFEKFSSGEGVYSYAWQDGGATGKEKENKIAALQKAVYETGLAKDFLPAEDNRAITYSGDDFIQDSYSVQVMLYIVVIIMAFIFVSSAKADIERESTAIGTLRATGYSRWQIIKHYATIPIALSILAAVMGVIIGHCVFEDIGRKMYYENYSLPQYESYMSWSVLFKTAIVPIMLIAAVQLTVLAMAMRVRVIDFLRGQLHGEHSGASVRLPNFSFLTRFRIRVLIQNLGAYAGMFVGVVLATTLMVYGLCLQPSLNHAKDTIVSSQTYNYRYQLKTPVATANTQAEAFTSATLTDKWDEDISIYGVNSHSDYVPDVSGLAEGQALFSQDYLDKRRLHVGDKVSFTDTYGYRHYDLAVAGAAKDPGSLSVYLPREDLNKTLRMDPQYFNGYFSNEKLDDLPDSAVANVLTQDDLLAVVRQLQVFMHYIYGVVGSFVVVLYLLVLYLVSAQVLERNERVIGLLKVLGYSTGETSKIFTVGTFFFVLGSILLSLPIASVAVRQLFAFYMRHTAGWMPVQITPGVYIETVVAGVLCFGLVALLQLRRISQINKAAAIKDLSG